MSAISAPHTPASQELRPRDITIAVTVYSRREYVLGAIRSALEQSVPVKVIVVEDCGPDATLRDFVLREFGSRIEYFRNARNRGLFDNWNACLEYCRTPWVSILHDDDVLHPVFVETMLALAKAAPGRSVYFGRTGVLSGGVVTPAAPAVGWPQNWRDLDPAVLAEQKTRGTARKLVAFKSVEKSAPPRPHYPIWSAGPDRRKIGRVTSGTQSPSLGIGIGMGYVPPEMAASNSAIAIEIRGKHSPATIVPKPLYRKG